eukprot:COSAG01_NODE_18071_length_1102_cov_2.519442_1_plen_344_part_01
MYECVQTKVRCCRGLPGARSAPMPHDDETATPALLAAASEELARAVREQSNRRLMAAASRDLLFKCAHRSHHPHATHLPDCDVLLRGVRSGGPARAAMGEGSRRRRDGGRLAPVAEEPEPEPPPGSWSPQQPLPSPPQQRKQRSPGTVWEQCASNAAGSPRAAGRGGQPAHTPEQLAAEVLAMLAEVVASGRRRLWGQPVVTPRTLFDAMARGHAVVDATRLREALYRLDVVASEAAQVAVLRALNPQSVYFDAFDGVDLERALAPLLLLRARAPSGGGGGGGGRHRGVSARPWGPKNAVTPSMRRRQESRRDGLAEQRGWRSASPAGDSNGTCSERELRRRHH